MERSKRPSPCEEDDAAAAALLGTVWSGFVLMDGS